MITEEQYNNMYIVQLWSNPDVNRDYGLSIDGHNIDSLLFKEYRDWCRSNLLDGYWKSSGVTRFSYRILFVNAEDAVAFKLKFGV